MNTTTKSKENPEQTVMGALSLRDYFAAKSMQALISCNTEIRLHTEKGLLIVPAREGIPTLAYEYADSMLKAREL